MGFVSVVPRRAKKQGAAVSLSDYTLCVPGQGYWNDEIIKEHPAMRGSVLRHVVRDVRGPTEVSWEVPENTLSAIAYRMKNRAIEGGTAMISAQHVGRDVRWQAPAGDWRLVAVSSQVMPMSINPLDPQSGKKVVEKFFQRFEDRCPGEGGKGLDFFFSDELELGINADWMAGRLWSPGLADAFRRCKGYDLLPELPALFVDVGPRTPKIRLDYRDVMVSLAEENYFRPLFQWHYDRGMVYGCDHGGRGGNVVEFGDYFRTQRWMTGPGNDSPGLGIPSMNRTKVHSSIAHLYQRPRVWLEGFYGSGWGSTTADLTRTMVQNFVAGSNLLTLHGLYYTTHGGWWEWAPPCNHFRMPYWPHMRTYLEYSQRLSYLLSQGVHRCDVAILYPVAPMEAGMNGQQAVDAAFQTGDCLFGPGGQAIDFDYMDFQSLERAKITNRQLAASGETYRVLVLPSMAAIRYSTIQKALEFYRAGGMVIAVGALPEASDRVGRDDPQLDAMVKELFGVEAKEVATIKQVHVQRNGKGGSGFLVQQPAQTPELIEKEFARDFTLVEPAIRTGTARCSIGLSGRERCTWFWERRRTPNAFSARRARSNCGTRGPGNPGRCMLFQPHPMALACECRWKIVKPN